MNFTDIQNLYTVPLLQPIDTTGAAATVDGIDLNGFGGRAYGVKIIVQLGNVAANVSAFDVVESASADLSTPTVLEAVTEPTAAAGDNDTYVFNLDLKNVTKRYVGIAITGGAGATLVNAVAVVAAEFTPESVADSGVNFNASAKTVLVSNID